MKKILLALTVTAFIASFTSPAEACMGKGKHKGEKKFDMIDKNSDGFVTKDEMTAHINAKFAKKDADGDGKISKEEMKKYHESKKGKHGHGHEHGKGKH